MSAKGVENFLFGRINHWGPVLAASGSIVASPLIWNIIARNEHKRGTLTRFLGSKYRGCYALAAWIFFSSLYRDVLFAKMIFLNPESTISSNPTHVSVMSHAARGLTAFGAVLVLSSMYKLGVTGTYLGDYFGILMTERVTGFPYNVCSDPMYTGAFMQFLGIALEKNSRIGVAVSGLVAAVYLVATRWFEGPYTSSIYAARDAANRKPVPAKPTEIPTSG